ncbi:hypothetical protein OROGR_002201 [Orobanche gracilis]
MGLWIAASRLGLCLAATARKTRNNNHLSLFKRRSSVLASPVADLGKKKDVKWCLGSETESESGSESGTEMEMEMELKKEKSLYLCFTELSQCGGAKYVTDVIRPVRLGSCVADDDDEEVPVVAYKRSKVYKRWHPYVRLGTQLLFPIGRKLPHHICWFDPTTRPIKFHVSSPKKTKIKSFSAPKHQMAFGELEGKLYCIHNNHFQRPPHSHPFEVFDPENDVKWRPLDVPPFLGCNYRSDYAVSFLEGSNKILGWNWNQDNTNPVFCPIRGVFCFDATKPENGWIETPPCLGDTLPFLFDMNPPFFIHDHHPDLGDFNLVFRYEQRLEPLCVSAFFMSNNCDSFHPIINKPLQLPEVCLEYTDLFDMKPYRDAPRPAFIHADFVHLGPKRVCLILHKFFAYDYGLGPSRPPNTGILCLLTFEYDIITGNSVVEDHKPAVEIEFRLLGTPRRLRYRSRKLHKPDDTTIKTAALTGAFVL